MAVQLKHVCVTADVPACTGHDTGARIKKSYNLPRDKVYNLPRELTQTREMGGSARVAGRALAPLHS